MLGQGAGAFHLQCEGWYRNRAAGQMRLEQEARLAVIETDHIDIIAAYGVPLFRVAVANLVRIVGMGGILVRDGRVAWVDLLARSGLPLIGAVRSFSAAHACLPLAKNLRQPQPFPRNMPAFKTVAT